MRPFVLSGIEVQAKVRALADLGMTPGPSNLSQRMVLDDCFAASRSLLLRAAPSTTRDRLLVHCAAVANEITAAAPSQSYAWFVKAVMAAEQGKTDALNASLVRSHATAPNEGWLAEARIDLAELNFARLGADAVAAEARDIGVAIAGWRVSRNIVTQYAENAPFRGRVDAVLASVPPAAQVRFIAAVRDGLSGAAL